MKKLGLLLIFTIVTLTNTFAIDTTVNQIYEVEMATGLRSSGKIWVVVSVLLTVVIGMYLLLFNIDRRVKKLEKNKDNK